MKKGKISKELCQEYIAGVVKYPIIEIEWFNINLPNFPGGWHHHHEYASQRDFLLEFQSPRF